MRVKKYRVKRPLLETLVGYIEALKCKPLAFFSGKHRVKEVGQTKIGVY